MFGPNGAVTPAIVDAITQIGKQDQICAFGYDLGPKQLEASTTGALTGSLGQQPFLQGFWPVMQLYLQIDRGIAAANLDTQRPGGHQGQRRDRRQALRELDDRLASAARERLSSAAPHFCVHRIVAAWQTPPHMTASPRPAPPHPARADRRLGGRADHLHDPALPGRHLPQSELLRIGRAPSPRCCATPPATA